MSEFQAGLLLIGALVILGVFAYNKWQENRARRAAEETFKSDHPDVLISGGKQSSSVAETVETRVEPALAPTRAPPVAFRHDDEEPIAPLPHSRIDYVIEIAAEESVSAASLHQGWDGIEHRFPSRTRLAGWLDGQWMPVRPDGFFDRFQIALQLVSRKGVVSESELLEFRSSVEALAAKLRFSSSAPEMRDALEAARSLDHVCADADIQVAFHVVADQGTAFSGTKLRAAAEAAGFTLSIDGQFTLADENGRELYVLSDRNGSLFSAATMKDAMPEALTLSMDVPRAPDTQRTFDAMVRFGKSLANLLGGRLVDDNNQPLDERSVATITMQLAAVRRSLEEQGIAPGSALALRLFS